MPGWWLGQAELGPRGGRDGTAAAYGMPDLWRTMTAHDAEIAATP